MTTRRDFLRSSAMVAATSMAGVAGAPQFAFGQSAGGKTLIKVFMRGGADGLHLFPPADDLLYHQYRPKLGIEPPNPLDANTAVDLGESYRALNPNLEPLLEIWNDGRLMVSPATALPEGNRSHFDNQRWIGTGARDNYIDGYLNRYMQNVPGPDSSLRGLVLGKSSISREISGELTVPAISSLTRFDVRSNRYFCSGDGCSDNQLTDLMREIATNPVNGTPLEEHIRANQFSMLEAIDDVAQAGEDYTPSADGMTYSDSPLGRGLSIAAQLIKAGIPLEVAAMDWNIGWDSHSNQITGGNNGVSNSNFAINRGMREGANDFVTFYRDMGNLMDDVVVLVGTEFGRTVKENGSLGTDHGHGGAWFAYGGPTVGGMGPDIASLEEDALLHGRYLPTVVNYRDIVAEIMVRHMGMSDGLISTIFPDHAFVDHNLFNRSA